LLPPLASGARPRRTPPLQARGPRRELALAAHPASVRDSRRDTNPATNLSESQSSSDHVSAAVCDCWSAPAGAMRSPTTAPTGPSRKLNSRAADPRHDRCGRELRHKCGPLREGRVRRVPSRRRPVLHAASITRRAIRAAQEDARALLQLQPCHRASRTLARSHRAPADRAPRFAHEPRSRGRRKGRQRLTSA
jgi:hypothetical protein